MDTITVDELKELGLDFASEKLNKKQEMKRKMLIAYENYRFVTPTKIEEFNKALRKKTEKVTKHGLRSYDKLQFIELKNYSEVPPTEVLESLRTAKDRKCFDRFEVAKIETVEERPDPILFGMIDGCNDRFFIDQWDSDVKIDDILGKMDG